MVFTVVGVERVAPGGYGVNKNGSKYGCVESLSEAGVKCAIGVSTLVEQCGEVLWPVNSTAA